MANRKKRPRVYGEGSVFQRSDGRWEARYQNSAYNGGDPIARSAKSEKEAYAKLEKIKQELYGGKLADGTTTDTVEEYVSRWLYTVKRYSNIRGQSFDRIESTVNT